MTTTEIEHHLWGAWSLTEEQAYKPICGKSTERNMFRELGPSYTHDPNCGRRADLLNQITPKPVL